jgi:hypothetical protein
MHTHHPLIHRATLTSSIASLLILCAVPAVAQQKPAVEPPITNEEVEQGDFRLDIGVGLKGGMNGAWMLEVPENADFAFNDESKSYYSAFGLGGDIGLMVDARALGIVGIETGLRFSFDNAQGFNELKDGRTDEILIKINQEQKTTSMRIPLLLKLSTANGTVRPTFSFGLEFVRQLDTTINYDVDEITATEPESATERRVERNQIEATNYKLVSGAFGIEIDLGPVKIPIELRAQYNLDYGGESFDDRVRVEGSGGDAVYYYNGAYQGHFGINIGVIYDLGLFL